MTNDAAEVPILLDIPRTYPDHPRFGVNGTDTSMLYNVLKAYSNFNVEIGYTQGMSFIVAVLLMHMNEEVRLRFSMPLVQSNLITFLERILGLCTDAEKVQFDAFLYRRYDKTVPCQPSRALMNFVGIYPQCLKDLSSSFKSRLPELDTHLVRVFRSILFAPMLIL